MKLIKYFVLNLFDFYLIFTETAIDLLKLNVLSINNLIEIISQVVQHISLILIYFGAHQAHQ